VANLAELRRLIGFTNLIRPRAASIQSDLLELLNPPLLDAMHGSPMLLPRSVHQHPRPFWVLSNIAAETDTAQIIDLLHRYDMELNAAAIAQGIDSPPQILTMINLIAIIPANLLPPPPPSLTEPPRRTPPRTNSYLLLPRAGAIMLNPTPSSASIEQAGPWHTAATIEVRDDGYLMDDIRTLARSGRSIATAATFSHPRTVNLLEYTEANDIGGHGDSTLRRTCIY
jgi:hypothetical protein